MNNDVTQFNANTNGDDVMTLETYTRRPNEYISEIDKYINQLKSKDQTTAKKEARESLYRSGITTKKGKLRKNIIKE